MTQKKICLVIASPLTIRFFLLGHIQMLAKEYDLTVITNTEDVHFLDSLNVPLRVISVLMERDVSLWRDFKALVYLYYIFVRERFYVVHSLSPKSGLLAMLAAWAANVPVRIHTFQGEVWVTRKGIWRWFLKSLDKLVAFCATHLQVVSSSEKQFLETQSVVKPGRLELLANGSICGVDTSRFKADPSMRKVVRQQLGIAESDIVILYVGRLNSDKGLLDLAQAYDKKMSEYPNVHLCVVGPDEGNIRTKMISLCKERPSHLHFLDYTPTPEHYMAIADIFCLPSYREGFGLVLIEAAACGLASVASRIYGVTDAVVEDKTGLLFEAGDVDDLARKLETLVFDPNLRTELGRNGAKRAGQHFSKELVLGAMLTYYKKITG